MLKLWYGGAVKPGVRLLVKELMWGKNLCEKELGKQPMHPPSGLGVAFISISLLLLIAWAIELYCSYASGLPWICWSCLFWFVLGPVMSLWTWLVVIGFMTDYGCCFHTHCTLLVCKLSGCIPGHWRHKPCLLSPWILS